MGTGTGPDCPSGSATFTNPMGGTVDARQPHPVSNTMPRQGIQTITATAPSGADPECWSICETSGSPAIAIQSVNANGNTYTIQLSRPITPNAVTRIAYSPETGAPTIGTFTFHPGNINGDSVAGPSDILRIIDCLNNVNPMMNCPWGVYSSDIDQSGAAGPADILRTVDLLNGADAFDVWNNTSLPAGTCTPP
jgi:hypothetical protein